MFVNVHGLIFLLILVYIAVFFFKFQIKITNHGRIKFYFKVGKNLYPSLVKGVVTKATKYWKYNKKLFYVLCVFTSDSSPPHLSAVLPTPQPTTSLKPISEAVCTFRCHMKWRDFNLWYLHNTEVYLRSKEVHFTLCFGKSKRRTNWLHHKNLPYWSSKVLPSIYLFLVVCFSCQVNSTKMVQWNLASKSCSPIL